MKGIRSGTMELINLFFIERNKTGTHAVCFQKNWFNPESIYKKTSFFSQAYLQLKNTDILAARKVSLSLTSAILANKCLSKQPQCVQI